MRLWPVDIEAFEQVSRDDTSRRLVLHMAQLSREGRLLSFVSAVTGDAKVDDEMRMAIAELAQDQAFLFAVEDYFARTRVLH